MSRRSKSKERNNKLKDKTSTTSVISNQDTEETSLLKEKVNKVEKELLSLKQKTNQTNNEPPATRRHLLIQDVSDYLREANR